MTATQVENRTGGQLLVDSLLALGVNTGFCVPGESYLAVLDALFDVKEQFELITCRNEGGAAFMAEAYGKLKAKPAACFVTRGPGACNASIGIHTALQDSTPLLLFIGQVSRDQLGREAFQEVNYREMFKPLAKWVTEIDDARRIPEILQRAWQIATSGRPGPVVVALPEDMLTDTVARSVLPAQTVRFDPPLPATAQDAIRAELAQAKRPLIIVGGGGWTEDARQALANFASDWHLPVVASFRRQDVFNNLHPNYIGELGTSVSPQLAKRVEEADLLLVIGSRLSEMTTNGYTLVQSPVPAQRLIHLHPDEAEINKVFRATVGVAVSVNEASTSLASMSASPQAPAWADWLAAAQTAYADNLASANIIGDVNMFAVMQTVNLLAPHDAIYTNGAGNYTGWLHRFHRYSTYPSQLAPTSGAMGYGLPAAIAAAVTEPDRTTICFAGDGCFMMNAQELATIARHQLKLIILLINNGVYGTIRMHQEKHYPDRKIATRLENPDFVAYAKSFGLNGVRVTKTSEFEAAFANALDSTETTLIEIMVDPRQVSTRSVAA
ncbi:thiamine pyrophosphate-binding protein [Leeia oryzae]|uniref:thiamine pyrophosphate-binding protein n=1 Tax=Leeia oryzae TaxID=356662 RepID=UPI000380F169|nr:thiamine pyrophosphate-binding protein [Leeia oryzae]